MHYWTIRKYRTWPYKKLSWSYEVEGDRGAGARGNGGRRGQEAREKGAERGSRNKEGDSLLFISGYYSVKNTHLAKFWNFHLTSTNVEKKILEARKPKFVLGLEKQHYLQWIWKSLQFDYIIGHAIEWHMTHVHLYFSVWWAVAVENLQQRKQFRVIQVKCCQDSINWPQYFSVWQWKICSWKNFLGAHSVGLHIPNYWRFCLMVQTCFKGTLLQWAHWRVRRGSQSFFYFGQGYGPSHLDSLIKKTDL